jgi:hypothetical protein
MIRKTPTTPTKLAAATRLPTRDALTERTPVPVQLQVAGLPETEDEALWTAIRSTNRSIDFGAYQAFVSNVFDPNASLAPSTPNHPNSPSGLSRFFGVEAYQMLKFATQAFLVLRSNLAVRPGGPANPRGSWDPKFAKEEVARGNGWTLAGARKALEEYMGKDARIPYLDEALKQITWPESDQQKSSDSAGTSSVAKSEDPIPGLLKAAASPIEPENIAAASSAYSSAENRLETFRAQNLPLLLELIWSFWREEGALVQTVNAIALRFQNRRGPAEHDPLVHLKLDPLRPLSNILWGYIQDEPNRLTLARRCYEYDSEYGLGLVGKAVPPMRTAESRSQFVEAFNNLLQIAYIYCKESDDVTVRADAFPVLNALKEVHHILAHGAHNQFGDLPWTARVEMLTQQWMLARPEIKDFIGGPPMVTYVEPWMGQVETMKALQGWSDVSVNHFRDLSTFGEMLLLSVRYGNWGSISVAANAANWAQYWRTEIQSYMHSYRAVTGVDVASDNGDSSRNEQPAVLHRRRVEMSRSRASHFGTAPRRLTVR